MTDEVLIVPTGTANTASVVAAFARLDTRPELCADPARIANAARVVLPGVGSFGAAATRIDDLALRRVLRERVTAGAPTLGICLGMQLLCDASAESPDVDGLGVIPARITALPDRLRVPQLGWNRVVPRGSALLDDGYAYFANSFCLAAIPDGWSGAETDYGGTFASALERGAVLACQFHPEISGDYGARVLSRWLQRSREAC